MMTDDSQKLFLSLLMKHQHRLRAYIKVAIPCLQDAEDVMQDLVIVLWQKFPDYRDNDQFDHWALSVARYTVLAYHRDRSRNKLMLDAELVDKILSSAHSQLSNYNDREIALGMCVNELSEQHRKILLLRYESGGTNRSVAQLLGINETVLSRLIKRLREILLDCVERRIAGLNS